MLSRIRNEPVAFVGLINTAALGLLALSNAFDWWSWSDEQQVAVAGVWAGLSGLATWIVRGSVYNEATARELEASVPEGYVKAP
jgi:hypothetical protein